MTSAMTHHCYTKLTCLKEADMAILKRTERAMLRYMCGMRLTDGRRNNDLMEMLGLEESVGRLAKANGVRWYGHILRRDELHPLRKALDSTAEIDGGGERFRLHNAHKSSRKFIF